MGVVSAVPLDAVGPGGRLGWLPAQGIGNGLDDQGWAPILDVDPVVVQPLLRQLRAAGVPAHAAPLPARRRSRRRSAWQIRVGSTHWSAAEECLRSALPALLQQFGPGVVR
jgi:hypothetical protein